MIMIVLRSLSIFIMILEVLLLLYIFMGMIHIRFLKKILAILLEPILLPIQILMKHSVFHTPISDLSPIVAVLLLSYIEQVI